MYNLSLSLVSTKRITFEFVPKTSCKYNYKLSNLNISKYTRI